MAYTTVNELFLAICDAIRSKKGTTAEIPHQDIPTEIESIESKAEPVVEPLVVPASTEEHVYVAAESGLDGYSEVTAQAVNSDIDSNIQPYNIKKDVAILGVVGTLEGGSGGIDWSTITDMRYAFYYNGSAEAAGCLKIGSLAGFDMSQVTNWSSTFYYGINKASINEVFKTLQLRFSTFSSQMFYGCSQLTDIPDSMIPESYRASNIQSIFQGCSLLPFSKAFDVISRNTYAGFSANSACSNVGNDLEDIELGDLEFGFKSFSSFFSGCTKIKKIGNIRSTSDGPCTFNYLFSNATNIDEVGTIYVNTCTSNNASLFSSKIKKWGGIIAPGQKDVGEILVSGKLITTTTYGTPPFEELTNIPLSYLRNGGTSISSNLYGQSKLKPSPLRRLTFSHSDEPYYTLNYAKNLDIKYCSFTRDGMVEMFNSLPDANDVTETKTITITGNPCVTDGTLTDEDIAIATAKGYSITM